MARILLIDDDTQLGAPLTAYLKRFDMQLSQALRPSEGLARLAAESFDAAILDVMLPEMDGFELCRQIRRDERHAELPLLMLSARGEVMDRVVGLELGADDYLPKPFEPRELAARLQTILRRRRSPAAASAAAPASLLRFDGVEIDLSRRSVQRLATPLLPAEHLDLTSTEFELLVLLAREPGRVWSRDEILERLRGQAAEDLYTRAVDILVSRLRRKLEPLDLIKTLRNAGYTFAGVRQ
jgi:OmpR family response regulator RpaB